ncbi:MAG: 16S rRNA (cytosine(967)-C(5))-methyltransferase RsmB [Candidatus Thioglobus sp.]|nr:16S rRNA (cytosine(967)-C(5))-methyltransferase RsmB [Candidatus Thioglobus sp.]
MNAQNNNARQNALRAICSVVLEKKSLSAFAFPCAHSQALTFGTIRFYHQLNDITVGLLKHPLPKENLDIHCLILLGAYQILHTKTPSHASIFETVKLTEKLQKSWAKGLVNAVLRQVLREKNNLLKQNHYSHPSWLVKKIKQYYPSDFEQIFTQNNTQAPMTLRIHPDFNQQNWIDNFGKKGRRLENIPQAFVLNQPVKVDEIADFSQGSCFVQDASPQLGGHFLEPKNDDLILDACAAPGGKTTHISELAPNSKIIALDKNSERLAKVQANIDRFKIQNVELLQGSAEHSDWWDGQLFDKILLDAPCSASGVIRRHPDIKLLRKPKDISVLVALQKQILDNIWQMLKPGGTLLYATCSILKNENELQIADFLRQNPNAKEQKIALDWGFPVSHGRQQIPCAEFDGFYYAKLVKI